MDYGKWKYAQRKKEQKAKAQPRQGGENDNGRGRMHQIFSSALSSQPMNPLGSSATGASTWGVQRIE